MSREVEAQCDNGIYNIYVTNDRRNKRILYKDRNPSELIRLLKICKSIGYEDITNYRTLQIKDDLKGKSEGGKNNG